MAEAALRPFPRGKTALRPSTGASYTNITGQANGTKVTVGIPVTRHPPYRSQRAELPHWAPNLGQTRRHSLPPVSCPVRTTLLAASMCRSRSSCPEFPLFEGLCSTDSACGWPFFIRLYTLVHLLHRYYASVRLLRCVHIMRAEIPSPTGPSVDCQWPHLSPPGFRTVGLRACPGSLTPQVPGATRANVTPGAAFPLVPRGRQPKRVISELNSLAYSPPVNASPPPRG